MEVQRWFEGGGVVGSGNSGGRKSVGGGAIQSSLRVVSSNNNTNLQQQRPSSTSPRPPPSSGPGSGKGIDMHPYSRSSVIEVLYVRRKKIVRGALPLSMEEDAKNEWMEEDESESDWFASSSSSEEDEDGADGDTKQQLPDCNISNNNTQQSLKKKNESSIYLCDVIDRSPLNPHLPNHDPNQQWKYYVHYRDFNRRMDEWITMDRIVSPPSVGNAKVRLLRKKKDEEEKERVRLEKREEEQRRKALLGDVGGMGGVIVSGARRASAIAAAAAISSNSVSCSTGDQAVDGAAVGGGSGSATVSSSSTAVATGAGGDVGTLADRKRYRRSASSGSQLDGGGAGSDTNIDVGATAEGGEPSRLTRRQRRTTGDVVVKSTVTVAEEHLAVDVVTTIAAPVLDEHEGMDDAALKEHEEVTKVKNVATLELGPYQMDTWYFSPLPKELFKDGGEELPKNRRHPPGNEIYRCGNLSMFEVDGFEERIYCQNLCYIAKLFLDHKTLYFDVDPFLFYVLCEVDERGYHPVGYYSKEKYSDVGYNLACILTFPSHQRKGYGRFLIAFSYELSKKEEKVGSPEKPMSDLGQQAYIPYWTSTIVDFMLNHSGNDTSMSIMDIAKKTSIMAEDIVFALNTLGILKFVNGVYFISAERGMLEELAKKHPVKEPRVDPSKLHWTPYLTDIKRDKFSISSKKASVEADS
eukprot:g7438.t1 g7438   contig24:623316-625776(-)